MVGSCTMWVQERYHGLTVLRHEMPVVCDGSRFLFETPSQHQEQIARPRLSTQYVNQAAILQRRNRMERILPADPQDFRLASVLQQGRAPHPGLRRAGLLGSH